MAESLERRDGSGRRRTAPLINAARCGSLPRESIRRQNDYRRVPARRKRDPLDKSGSDHPDFKADSVSLAASPEKEGKLRLVYAGSDDFEVVQPDEVLELGASSQGVEATNSAPPTGER